MNRISFLGLVLGGLVVLIELINFSFFSFGVWGIDLDYCDVEGFALEMTRDHSAIFETEPKYCISESFVDHKGYFIFFRGFLPTVADTMIL